MPMSCSTVVDPSILLQQNKRAGFISIAQRVNAHRVSCLDKLRTDLQHGSHDFDHQVLVYLIQ